MAKKGDSKKIERKIKEALNVLASLGFPRQQQNERLCIDTTLAVITQTRRLVGKRK